MNLPINQIIHGDCLEVMKTFPDKSVDLVLTDPPYGTTGLEWDKVPNLEVMWSEIVRIVKDSSAIVMTSSQPFTTDLINSNRGMYRYSWVWNKKIGGNPLIAKYQPLKVHEDICVFSKKSHNYYPIMRQGVLRKKGGGKSKLLDMEMSITTNDNYYPTSVLEFSNAVRGAHPTQKPVDLFSYLVGTYSKEGDTILDPFGGSCTTAVACVHLKRNYICIEKEEKYVNICNQRLATTTSPMF